MTVDADSPPEFLGDDCLRTPEFLGDDFLLKEFLGDVFLPTEFLGDDFPNLEFLGDDVLPPEFLGGDFLPLLVDTLEDFLEDCVVCFEAEEAIRVCKLLLAVFPSLSLPHYRSLYKYFRNNSCSHSGITNGVFWFCGAQLRVFYE